MAKAQTSGGGWRGQSLRHSNARKYGHAGGTYAVAVRSPRRNTPHIIELFKTDKARAQYMKKIKDEFPSYKMTTSEFSMKDMTYKQLKKAGVKLSPNGDADKDGVKNKKDCRPLNKHAQDDGMPASDITITNFEPVAKAGASTIGIAEKGLGIVEEGVGTIKEGVKGASTIITKGEDIVIEKEKNKRQKLFEKAQEEWVKFKEQLAKSKAEDRKRQQSRLVKELETEENLTQDDLDRINDLEPSELNDTELKILAIREKEGLFGGNTYENEILRRIRTEAKIETDKVIEIQKAKIESAKRIAENDPEQKKKGGGGDDFFTWITTP